MGHEESFKSILEAALEGFDSPRPRSETRFFQSDSLGTWAAEITLERTPRKYLDPEMFYRRWAPKIRINTPSEKNVNAAPKNPSKKPKIPSEIEWKDEILTAKMIFNTYGDLRITEKSSLKDLKTAYKRLLFKVHPDRNIEDREAHQRFLQLQRAYQALRKSINE